MHLITGATGLVGNNVVRTLLNRGIEVRVLLRRPNDRALAGLKLDVVRGDVRDAQACLHACEGVERVIHCAGNVHIGWRDVGQWSVNVEGAVCVAQAARQLGVRMVHVSTVDALGTSADGKPANEDSPKIANIDCGYVRSKRAAEQALHREIEAGADIVIVNPGLMFGPWDWKPSSGKIIQSLEKTPLAFAPRGGASVVDVGDVADGILRAAEQGKTGRNYILSGENLLYRELWKLILNALGRHIPVIPMGKITGWLGGATGDLIGRLSGTEPDINSAAVAMGSRRHYYSSARAQQELGFHSRPTAEAIAAACEWLKRHANTPLNVSPFKPA